MKRIIGHVKNYIIAYLTAVMVYGMVFGICIEQAHADNAPVAAKCDHKLSWQYSHPWSYTGLNPDHIPNRPHGRTRNDNGQRTTVELRQIEK